MNEKRKATENYRPDDLTIDRPIILVGLMGVGKSTVGRRLAAMLKLDFVDADNEIEDAAAMSIAEIFEEFDEEYFRDGERRVIARLIEDRPQVIATGGGAFINDETRALILERGIAVWLDANIDTLVERVNRRDTRPLLRGGNAQEILTDLAKKRNPFYAKAHVHVTSQTGPHNRMAKEIIKAIQEWKS
ncbi:shikimate kinase [Sphingorhabdus sp. Alg239-R122]|uniref:shikimate kinase n=1 Tax=Sphingorhabdus sp. Alg239-R122 TaxID=2305989 RepID=UPI0013DD6268|nr:shikimate kinase [Sphingorhabdus sp. Alg239-R122]